ncbi:MAG: PHP domain-containing protein [Clostridiales bacterium]|jgi:PHP family Zn ribbon phosphoesterase|nr:PHP domain-containing protein [Clostridiales bacterium]
MKIAVDLHIHSALSPCADDDMTPNNIVNMAVLKGLDAIAVTDHNSCDNVEAVIKAAGNRIIIVPGMEVQSREDVHLLCYFNHLEALREFDGHIRKYLDGLDNISEIFGNQYIMDERDQIIGERKEMLLSSVDLSVEQLVQLAVNFGGVAVPAHVDRPSYSIISQLGFIPPDLNIRVLEFSHNSGSIVSQMQEYQRIISSDAHSLGEILEREMFLDVDNVSLTDIIQWLTCPCVI